MKLSLNWLKQYVNINTDVADLAHNLTMAGLEVNEVITLSLIHISEPTRPY